MSGGDPAPHRVCSCEAEPQRRFGKKCPFTSPFLVSPWASPLARPFTPTATSPRAASPPLPQLGSLGLSSGQSLVRKPACLSSSQWCCSAVPMATAPGVLPLPGNCPEPVPVLSKPLLEADREGERLRAGQETQPKDARAARRNRPLRVMPGPAGGLGAGPGLQQSPTRGLGAAWLRLEPAPGPGSAVSGASWPCPPAGPPRELPPEPEATCQPHGCSTPTVLPACAPAKPHCRSSCHRQLSPRSIPSAHPQPFFQNATAKCQPPPFLSPRPLSPRPAPGPCLPDLHSRQRLGHTCRVPGRGWCQRAGAESWR